MAKVADMPKGARFQLPLGGSYIANDDAVYISRGYVHPHTNRLQVIDQWGHPQYIAGHRDCKRVAAK